MFIDATPGDELLKLCKKIENENKINDKNRIKFVSKTGLKLSNLVQRRDPFQENCNDKNCIPSQNGKSSNKIIKCKKNNIVYKA